MRPCRGMRFGEEPESDDMETCPAVSMAFTVRRQRKMPPAPGTTAPHNGHRRVLSD